MIPVQLIAGAALAALAFFSGWKVNGWRMDAAQRKADAVEIRAITAATDAAVAAIQGIEVRYVPVRQKAEIITRDHVVYRECQHSADGLRLVNEALAGADPAGAQASLSGPDPAH